MIRVAFVVAGLGLGVTAVMAQSNPIAERQQAMKAIGAASREGAAIAKGDAFDAAKAQSVFKAFADAAQKLPMLFPDDSKTGDNTRASAKIWEDQAGFKAAVAKFEADAQAGAKATDLASFRTAFDTATRNCGTCHEAYRARR